MLISGRKRKIFLRRSKKPRKKRRKIFEEEKYIFSNKNGEGNKQEALVTGTLAKRTLAFGTLALEKWPEEH